MSSDAGWEGLNNHDMAAMVLERLRSREWWLLVPLGEGGTSVIDAIERTYYPGESNADFHLLIVNDAPWMSFFLARKSHMTAQQITEVFHGSEDAKELLRRALEDHQRDVLFLATNPCPEDMIEATNFLNWFRATILEAE